MENNLVGHNFRLGILGGGQLGRMFIQAASNYAIQVHIMDKDKSAPSYELATSFTVGNINNYDHVISFGKNLDVLTVEIENVNIDALYALEKIGVKVFPQPRVLEIIVDKGKQKKFFKKHAIPSSKFELFEKKSVSKNLAKMLPFVQKLRIGGYDGRGVEIIKSESELTRMFEGPTIVEELVDFTKELSVIVARNENRQTAVYPTVECEFNDANLVEYLFSPADIDASTERKAEELAMEIIDKLEMVGILAVEFFLTESGELLVNEIAPRPHNSGHHTIECNVTSQFEQHLRAILNLPLGSCEVLAQGVMLNLIGEVGHEGKAHYKGLEKVIEKKGVHVHLYGKEMTKANRKMGHITIARDSMTEAKKVAKDIKGVLRVQAQT